MSVRVKVMDEGWFRVRDSERIWVRVMFWLGFELGFRRELHLALG